MSEAVDVSEIRTAIRSNTRGTILLAAGGTGGHLFPAFALAEELQRRQWRIELATDMRGERYGADFPAADVHHIDSATLRGRSPISYARTSLALAKGIRQAYVLIGRMKPAVVVGFGGYPCFPPLVAARLHGIKTALHEQNAVLGRANRMLAARVTAIATSFDEVKYVRGRIMKKARFTGNPVRDKVLAAADVPYPAAPVEGSNERFRILVFGGSQGARFFSERVPPALGLLNEALRARITVVQQCREEDIDGVRAAYAESGIEARCETFFGDLPDVMAASHLVIGRAGASSVAELTVVGRPSILVPLPHSLDNDQLYNAATLAEAGGALCIAQDNLSAERLAGEIEAMMADPALMAQAAVNAKSVGRPDAVTRLADMVEELAGAIG